MPRLLIASALLVALLAVLAGLIGAPAVQLWLSSVCVGEGGRYVVRAAASWYFGSRLIEAGRASEVFADCLPHKGHYLTCEIHGLVFSTLAILGFVHVPSQCLEDAEVRTLDLPGKYRRVVRAAPVFPETDFCRSLLDYQHTSQLTVQATFWDAEDFVRACRAEFQLLSSDLRVVLDPVVDKGPIPAQMLRSSDGYSGGNCSEEAEAQEEQASPEALEAKMPQEELAELLRAGGDEREQHDEARFQRALKLWSSLDIRKARDLGTNFEGVGEALQRGEVARFRATPLFPRELFNITHAAVAALEGDGANKVPIYSHLPGSKPRSLADHARDPRIGYVNAKRLPRLHKKLPDIARVLGIEERVLHCQNFVWLGIVQGPGAFTMGRQGCRASFHWDPEPNAYVQLSGETRFLLIPQSFTERATRCGQNYISFSCEDVEGLRPLAGFPIIFVHLRPGDGLIVPSRTHHLVSVQSNDRVALNYFFMPRWRDFESSPGDYYTKTAKSNLVQLAMRQLWIRSMKRVHNKTGKALYSNAGRLEWF